MKCPKEVKQVITNYPKEAQNRIWELRELIFQAAEELDEITEVEETLKWGEPSYLTKYGGTFHFEGDREIRFDLEQEIPEKELKKCIKAALMYHKVKNEPNLAIS